MAPMNRIGLLTTLAIAALAGLVFAIDPNLDTRISRAFIEMGAIRFGLSIDPSVMMVREFGKSCIAALVASAALGIIVKLAVPRVRLWMSTRAMTFLLLTFLLGPGVLVNVMMKEHWARSRPVDVVELGGTDKFMPWWDPRGECPANCSFVSGDAAAAYWTVAAAAVAPPQWRAVAYGGALAFGVAASVLRVVVGAHFVSDVVFSGVLMFLLVWLMHGVMIRWPRTRVTEDEAENAVTMFALRWREAVRDLLRKPRTDP